MKLTPRAEARGFRQQSLKPLRLAPGRLSSPSLKLGLFSQAFIKLKI